jgi:hypothetical protein
MATNTDLESYTALPTILGADKRVDAADVYATASNAAHLADMSGQVLCCWSLPTGVTGPRVINYDAGSSAELVRIWVGGPYHLRQRPDGTAYPIRARLAGSRSTFGTITIGVVLGPSGASEAAAEFELDGDNVFSTTVSSSSVSSFNAASGPLTVNVDPTPRGVIEDSVPRSTLARVIFASVFVRVNSTTDALPRLEGLYLAEYIGT